MSILPLRLPNTPRKPRILLVPPPELPVPAVQGGAVETLVTHLIRENERAGKLDLLCASIPDPEAAGVFVFNGISFHSTFDPPLTTIRQERNELGRCAYDILNSLIHHIPISKTLLRPKLIERESTARCAHRD